MKLVIARITQIHFSRYKHSFMFIKSMEPTCVLPLTTYYHSVLPKFVLLFCAFIPLNFESQMASAILCSSSLLAVQFGNYGNSYMMSYTFLGYLNGTCDADSSQFLGKKAVFFLGRETEQKHTDTHKKREKQVVIGNKEQAIQFANI